VDTTPASTEASEPTGLTEYDVLRNRKVCVDLARLDPNGDPIEDKNGDIATEQHWFRLTAHELGAISDAFHGYVSLLRDPETNEPLIDEATGRAARKVNEGVDGFVAALSENQLATVTRVLSIALDRPLREVAASVLPERGDEYNLIISTAWAIAHGVKPSEAGKALAAMLTAARELRTMKREITELELRTDEPEETPAPSTTRGGSGSRTGRGRSNTKGSAAP
jgi:hypothetical protein